MSNADVLDQIFRVVLERPDTEDVRGLCREDEEAWDSLIQMSIVAAIESEFSIALNNDQIENLTSYGDALALIDQLAPAQ